VVAVSGDGGGGSRLRMVVLPLLLRAFFSRHCVSFLLFSSSTSASPCFSVLFLLYVGGGGSDWDCGQWLGNQVAVALMVVLRRFFFSVMFSSLYLSLFFFFFFCFSRCRCCYRRLGGTEMVESRHSCFANQCCCFPSSSQCCSSGRKMAAAVLLLLFLCCLPFLSSVFCSPPLFSVLPSFSKILPPPHLVSSPLVFIGKRRESPHCLVPSWSRRETRLPYLCRVRWSAVCRA